MKEAERALLLAVARIVLAHHTSSGSEANAERATLRRLLSCFEGEPFTNANHARTCALYWDKLLQGIDSACGCGGLAKDRSALQRSPEESADG